jgi:hypothetical protein
MMTSNPLDDLTEDHCRYVIGEVGVDWCFCRKPRARKSDGTYERWMWCDEHRRIVVRPTPAFGSLMRRAA